MAPLVTVMGNRTLELNISSASNLRNVNLMTKMDVYVDISIRGDETQKKQKVKTTVDRSGGSNPTWNHTVQVSVNERLARDGRLTLVMKLMSRRVLGNKVIGRVNVPLLELLYAITPSVNDDGNGQGMNLVTYQVRTPSGKRRGSLTFSYRFEMTPVKVDFPAIVNQNSVETVDPLPSELDYPSTPPSSPVEHIQSQPPCQNDFDHQKHPDAVGSSLDPLPISYGPIRTDQPYFCSSAYDKPDHDNHHVSRSPPPQFSYAYLTPPPPSHHGCGQPSTAEYGYGCPSSPPPEGIGLGLGLGAGLLAGLMMGDIVSDVANSFDL